MFDLYTLVYFEKNCIGSLLTQLKVLTIFLNCVNVTNFIQFLGEVLTSTMNGKLSIVKLLEIWVKINFTIL